MDLKFSEKIFWFFPVLFCFCLPFGSLLLSWIIVTWTLFSFLNLKKQDLVPGIRSLPFLLFTAFFILTAISAAFSTNKAEALFSIEVKMTFLIFPYLFFCFKWSADILRRCIIAFVSGCFFACIYLLGRALLFTLNGQPEYFFYTMFSDLLHASYFSMYLLLALIFIILLYPSWFRHEKSIIYSSWFFASIFITTIFLCSSKMGMISLVLTIPALLITRQKHKLKTPVVVISAAALLIIFVAAFYFLSGYSERLSRMFSFDFTHVDKTSSESTAVRFLIWQQCIDIINGNALTGTGVGDANDALYQAYLANGLEGAYSHKLNAHNQFFQTFIGMGIAGFVLLLVLTFGELMYAVIKRKILLMFFSFIIILNFLVESMLQTSAGVLFFVFFSCLFFLADREVLSEDTLPLKNISD